MASTLSRLAGTVRRASGPLSGPSRNMTTSSQPPNPDNLMSTEGFVFHTFYGAALGGFIANASQRKQVFEGVPTNAAAIIVCGLATGARRFSLGTVFGLAAIASAGINLTSSSAHCQGGEGDSISGQQGFAGKLDTSTVEQDSKLSRELV